MLSQSTNVSSDPLEIIDAAINQHSEMKCRVSRGIPHVTLYALGIVCPVCILTHAYNHVWNSLRGPLQDVARVWPSAVPE
jgi:hypothetical protein